MKKILVTGSNGFVGKNLVLQLQKLNYSVIHFSGNILEDDSYRKLHNEDIEHCFHLAAKSFVPDSWKSPSEFIENNVYGTEKVLEFCRIKNVSLTFMSSYLYGSPQYLPINEQHPIQTPNPYAMSKYLAEELCRFYAEHYKLKLCIIRPFNIYGPNQDKRFLIPELIQKFSSTEDKVEVKDLTPKRDYVFISDLIDALILTLKISDSYSLFNIGSGYSLSVKEIIDVIKTEMKSTKQIVSNNEVRVNEIPDTVADVSLALKKLNWKPKVSFKEGIIEILKTQKV